MSDKSNIQWTEATWNPVAGYTRVSAGCDNCYAVQMSHRLELMGQAKYAGLTVLNNRGDRHFNGTVRCDEDALTIPLKWRKPRRVFVNSMSDLFHDSVPADFISRVWDVMRQTPQHTYQILTKRPARMREVAGVLNRKPLPNAWLGTTVEHADTLWRLDELRKTPAAIHFVSFEPLLGSVADADLTKIQWAIVGGESGPRARPMDKEWVEEIRDLCREYDTAFFFKQWGGTNKAKTGRKLNGRTWDAMPARIT